MESLNKWIKRKSLDPAIKVKIRIFASFLVALSGFMLYTDKVLHITLENNFGFNDTQTFLWVFTQSISPLLLIFAFIFKPYRLSFAIPIYMYAVQLIWVFNPNLDFDDALLQVYALGSVIAFILLVFFINYIFSNIKSKSQHKISFLEQALDLSLTLNKTKE